MNFLTAWHYPCVKDHDQTSMSISVNDKKSAEEIPDIDGITHMPKLFIKNTYNEAGECMTVYTETRFDKRGNAVYTDTYDSTEEKGANERG